MPKKPAPSKASARKTCRSDSQGFLEGLNAEDFSVQGPVRPDPVPVDPFGEELPPDYVWPYEIITADGTKTATSEDAAMGILRAAARGNLEVWHLCNRHGKQWKRARCIRTLYGFNYKVERIEHGQIKSDSEVNFTEAEDLGF